MKLLPAITIAFSLFFFYSNSGDIMKNKQPEEKNNAAIVTGSGLTSAKYPFQGGDAINDLVFSLDKGNKIIRYILLSL